MSAAKRIDASLSTATVAAVAKDVIAPFRSPSADWNAPTISVNESKAAGSVLEITKSTLVFNESSADSARAISVDNAASIEASATLIAAATDSSPTIRKDASASMLFCNEVSATIARDSSASTSASRLATSVERLAASDSSPATREEASAESAAFITFSRDTSADFLSDTSLLMNIMRLDTSVDITSDTFVSMDVTTDCKPSISATTIPTGAVICALSNIKSDCLFKTILVSAIFFRF